MGANASRQKAGDARSLPDADRVSAAAPATTATDDMSDRAPSAAGAKASTASTDSSAPDSGVQQASEAKKKVQVIRVDPVETYEDNCNQTGLSEYEMARVDRFHHTPYRRRGRQYQEMQEADNKKQEDRRARKEERKQKRRSKSKKGANEPEEVLPNTIPWAIQNAKRLGVLNLSKMDLDSVPEEIFDSMPGTCRIINISMNRLAGLEPRMFDYVLVQRLIANNNLLASVHPGIQRMTALKKLDLAKNSLTILPDAFASLRHLELVDLSYNKLTTLPPSFASLNLTDLNLRGNMFSVSPPQIEGMENVLELDISENQLEVIPETWMSFTRLISLRLDHNNLGDFPAVILQLCPDLLTLSLRGNPIKMSVLEAKESYHLFEERRGVHLKRQVEAGSVRMEDLIPADR